MLSSETIMITEEVIAFDNVEILCETRMNLTRDNE